MHQSTLLAALAVFSLTLLSVAKAGQETKQMELSGGGRISYVVFTPDGWDRETPLPAILAFAGGGQSLKSTEGTVRDFFAREAEARGYLVVAPAAQGDRLYFRDGDRIFPEFLEKIMADYPVQDRRFHAAGISNGGLASFHIAAKNPDYIKSITGFPGFLWEASQDRYQAIKDKCIAILAGENDTNWVQMTERDRAVFRDMGKEIYVRVFENEGHVPESLRGEGNAILFDLIEQQAGC